MDLTKNYYNILQIPNTASDETIKKVYRELALIYHPDKNSADDAKHKFQEISEAYTVVGTKKFKDKYDKQSIYGKHYVPYEFKFKSTNKKTGYEEQLNLTIEINLTLSEIYANKSKIVEYSRYKPCTTCNGSGFEPNEHYSKCIFCDGNGKILRNSNVVKCKYCKGTGKLYRNKCTTCDGTKVTLETEKLTMNNVFMIKDHKTVRYAGYGHYSKYFENKIGELIIFINIIPYIYYKRIDDDLHIEEHVHFANLITGGKLEIDLPDESTYTLNIPEKCSANEKFVIKEKGFVKKNKQRGNLCIKINVIIDYDQVSEELIHLLNGKVTTNKRENQ